MSTKFISDKHLRFSGSGPAKRFARAGAISAAALAAICGTAMGQDNTAGAPAGDTGANVAQPEEEEMITLAGFSGPVELRALLDFAVDELQINLWADQELSGQVTLNAPVSFPKSDLLFVLDTILEGHGWAILPAGIPNTYTVEQKSSVRATIGVGLSTTQLIETPNVKPSSLKIMLDAQFGAAGAGAGGGGSTNKISYIDDAGFIVATGTPATIRSIEALVGEVLKRRSEEEFFRIELEHIGATAAIEQASQLMGLQVAGAIPNAIPNQALAGVSNPLGNLKDRLTVSPQGNALVFRGRQGEMDEVQRLIDLIDVASTLPFKPYFTGSETLAIAELASKQGLGDVVQMTQSSGFSSGLQQQLQNLQQFGLQTQSTMGGSKLVVSETRGWVYYSGTQAQQDRFASLVEEFKAEDELSVVDVYKLQHSDAEKIAEIINGLLEGALAGGGSPLMAQGQQGRLGQQRSPSQFDPPEIEGEGEPGGFNPGPDVYVIADVDNNQIIVKAPRKQQKEFASLIDQLDLRRPQVYLEAQIVAVNATEDFRLRFESQIIAGQLHLSSLNGLSDGGDSVSDPLSVPAGLLGATAAVIKSEYVPIVINALQQNADGRILASPRLLVNDNDETTIANVDSFPYAEASQNNTSTISSFSGSADAGTTFKVRPRISSGDYINLTYDIELSSFTGPPPSEGAPPPARKTNITGGSVTVPGGQTIVVGGLSFENSSETVVKIPLLGDIPLIGDLFRDTQKSTQKTTIYVFITPRIMRNDAFGDLRILTQGPQAEMELDPDVPVLEPVMMRLQSAPVQGDSGTVRRRSGEG